MKCGFTFKGKHSDDFGAVVRTRSRPIRPEAKTVFAEALAADGSYDFSEANPYGRYFYNDRIFELELQVGAENLYRLELKISKIARWLTGRGDLIFDDMPHVKWRAAALSEIGFMPELTGHKAALTAVMRVSPFSRTVFDTMNGIPIGTRCRLESPIPLDVRACFTFDCAAGFSSFDVDNIGTWYVRPVIRFVSDAEINELSMTVNGALFALSGARSREIVIDCERQTVTDGSGNSLIGCMKGGFFELPYDEASDFAVIIDADAVMTVEYEPCCVYDFDFMEWGDYDA